VVFVGHVDGVLSCQAVAEVVIVYLRFVSASERVAFGVDVDFHIDIDGLPSLLNQGGYSAITYLSELYNPIILTILSGLNYNLQTALDEPDHSCRISLHFSCPGPHLHSPNSANPGPDPGRATGPLIMTDCIITARLRFQTFVSP